MSEAKDYYKILGVNENASDKEIKQAFHNLAFKYHPDRPGGDEKKFKEINEAFQVIGTKEKRDQYDNMKKYGFNQGSFPGGNASGFNWSQADFGGFDGFGDINDIFGSFFNQSFSSKQNNIRRSQNQDIETLINVSLKESYVGVKKNIKYDRVVFCEHCEGKGYEKDSPLKTCNDCKGSGTIEKKRQVPFFGYVVEKQVCEKCDGEGKIADKKCKHCNAKKHITQVQNQTIDIPLGIRNNDVLEVTGLGNHQSKTKRPGNLYIRVSVSQNDDFWREGDNLCTMMSINFSEAALGVKKEIKNIDDKNIVVEIPRGVDNNAVLKIKNKGFKKVNQNGFGDMLILLKVKTPKKLSKKAEELFDQLRKEL